MGAPSMPGWVTAWPWPRAPRPSVTRGVWGVRMASRRGETASRYPLRQVLAADGTVVGEIPPLSREDMVSLYRRMVVTRTFDQRALSLQRQGRIGTYAPVGGQEAVQVASAFALRPEEWLFPTYRDYGAMYTHGMPLRNLFLFPMGHPEGACGPQGVAVYPISIAIATHLPHAVGAAWASRYLGERRAFLAFHGDGATSEGDFHEALNFAGVFRVPLVVVCENNGWAISVPRSRQTASPTLAQKADAYGIPAVLVDGNDALAVYQVVHEALERARAGEGPTFVEALTYRLGPHTTADDPTRYRSEEERRSREGEDPLLRMRRFLMQQGFLDEAGEEDIWQKARAEVAEAVRAAEETPPPAPDFFFDYVYATPTGPLQRQRQSFVPEEEG
jgi:pyruvate dehydrogenase E1 component alpha subunit